MFSCTLLNSWVNVQYQSTHLKCRYDNFWQFHLFLLFSCLTYTLVIIWIFKRFPHLGGKKRVSFWCTQILTRHFHFFKNRLVKNLKRSWQRHKQYKSAIVISHRRAGVLCLHWGGLLHLAGGLCLGLQGRERQGGFRGCAHGWGGAGEATRYMGWGGGGPTRRGWGGGPRWHLGLCRSMVLLLLRLQAGRGIGWRGGTQGGLGCRATGQLGAKRSQCIQGEVRVLRLLERRGMHS